MKKRLLLEDLKTTFSGVVLPYLQETGVERAFTVVRDTANKCIIHIGENKKLVLVETRPFVLEVITQILEKPGNEMLNRQFLDMFSNRAQAEIEVTERTARIRLSIPLPGAKLTHRLHILVGTSQLGWRNWVLLQSYSLPDGEHAHISVYPINERS